MIVWMPWLALAQQAVKSDIDLARQGALALATAHGETPRYGGKCISVGNEEVPTAAMPAWTTSGSISQNHRTRAKGQAVIQTPHPSRPTATARARLSATILAEDSVPI